MTELKLNRPDGSTVHTFDFPDSTREIKLRQYIDYVVARREAEKQDLPAMLGVAMSVSGFFGVDIHKILEGVAGVGKVDDDMLAHTVGALYVKLDEVISGYQPKLRTDDDFRFTWKDVEYHAPHLTFSAITGQLQKTPLSVYEFIEADVTMQKAQEQAQEEGDLDGSIWLSEYVRLIAILMRKEGETLPFNPVDREAFLQARSETFADIPLEIAMDVDFFLSNGLRNSKPVKTIIGTLILPLLLIQAMTQKRLRMQSPAKKAKRVTLSNGRVYGGYMAN